MLFLKFVRIRRRAGDQKEPPTLSLLLGWLITLVYRNYHSSFSVLAAPTCSTPPATGNTWTPGSNISIYIDPTSIPTNTTDPSSPYYQIALGQQNWQESMLRTGISILLTTNPAQANITVTNNPQTINGQIQPGFSATTTHVFQSGSVIGIVSPVSTILTRWR